MSLPARRRLKSAFLLGAGLGTRLRPLTEECPKPLLPLGGRPMITYAMAHLMGAGVDRFIVNTHHCPEAWKKSFPKGSWRGAPITFRFEPVLLDTGGGLKNIEDLLGDDEAIICYNGDIVTNLPLGRLLAAHEAEKPEVTMALRSTGPLLNVSIDGEGRIVDLRHTLGNPGVRNCLFAGIYVAERAFLSFLEAGRIESVIAAFLRRIKDAAGSVRGVVIDEGQWYDVGSIDAYEALKGVRPWT